MYNVISRDWLSETEKRVSGVGGLKMRRGFVKRMYEDIRVKLAQDENAALEKLNDDAVSSGLVTRSELLSMYEE